MRKTIAFVTVIALMAMVLATVPGSVSADYSGDITINADGSITPSDAPITRQGCTYTLTDNIYGTITIQKSRITLDGDGYSVIGAWTGFGVFVEYMAGVTVKNLQVEAFFYGILIGYSNGVTIEGSAVSNCYRGIYLARSYHCTVKGNSVSMCASNGIRLYSSHSNTVEENTVWYNNYGIYLRYSNRNTVKGNTISENAFGVYFSPANDNVLKMNLFQENIVAFMSWYSTGNRITLNTVVDNEHGLSLCDGSNKNVIHKNTVIDNDLSITYPWPSSGIYLQVCSGNTIFENTVTSNQFGFWFWWASDNIIKENMVSENDLGFRIEEDSDGNVIHTNNIIDNTVQAEDEGINTWDNGAEGNYWSDYMGSDLNHDGVGDTDLPHQGVDSYPLMNPC
ncbi:MAG: right-handed parallel beta-helix repeat-containing protein [Methanomassiliicoccales archaeon]|nr:MAG: right-handed parallel beta-helix repeat-containing protein [Methanomassiliicoccales archaeon]